MQYCSKLKVSQLLDPAIKSKKSGVERHHLFRKAYLKTLGITEVRQTNQIANYALVEWSDNIVIKDKAPAQYFPEYRALYKDNSTELKLLMQWHALPDGVFGQAPGFNCWCYPQRRGETVWLDGRL